MMYRATDKQRNAQKAIVHTCDCGRELRGNAAWASHRKANPTHKEKGEGDG